MERRVKPSTTRYLPYIITDGIKVDTSVEGFFKVSATKVFLKFRRLAEVGTCWKDHGEEGLLLRLHV
jgi:hypothetical protein